MRRATKACQRPPHPAQRFTAPRSIERGIPLAALMNRRSAELLAESLEAVYPAFDRRRFLQSALPGLLKLGLIERAAQIAGALAGELPPDFKNAAPVLVAALGPELSATDGVGLAPFFYLPHSQFIGRYGPSCVEAAMAACYELTRRFTAEFCVRPLIVADQPLVLRYLEEWASDPNPHVRRLVSEGSRPRLPWGLRLKALQRDPRPALRLLERLKDDSELYVRRSVANHLGDILKDNSAIGYATCERWLREVRSGCEPEQAAARRWIVRHAVRLPAKKGDARALGLRLAAQRPSK